MDDITDLIKAGILEVLKQQEEGGLLFTGKAPFPSFMYDRFLRKELFGDNFFLISDVDGSCSSYVDTSVDILQSYEYLVLPYSQNDGVIMVSSQTYFEGEAEPYLIPGDANGDGAVDTVDALLVLRCALSIDGDPADMMNCDMDGNGVIDTVDALLVLRRALNIG